MNVQFLKQTDGSFELILTIPEGEYLQLNEILNTLNMTSQEVIDLFFNEVIRTKKIPFDVKGWVPHNLINEKERDSYAKK